MPRYLTVLLLVVALAGCSGSEELTVTATAYNTVRGQTLGNPKVGAWGDRIKPNMKIIAVSRDLLELGLGKGTVVEIEGFPGEYVVLDKMHRRWKKRIDIHMGEDVKAARQFGKRELKIRWRPE